MARPVAVSSYALVAVAVAAARVALLPRAVPKAVDGDRRDNFPARAATMIAAAAPAIAARVPMRPQHHRELGRCSTPPVAAVAVVAAAMDTTRALRGVRAARIVPVAVQAAAAAVDNSWCASAIRIATSLRRRRDRALDPMEDPRADPRARNVPRDPRADPKVAWDLAANAISSAILPTAVTVNIATKCAREIVTVTVQDLVPVPVPEAMHREAIRPREVTLLRVVPAPAGDRVHPAVDRLAARAACSINMSVAGCSRAAHHPVSTFASNRVGHQLVGAGDQQAPVEEQLVVDPPADGDRDRAQVVLLENVATNGRFSVAALADREVARKVAPKAYQRGAN